jgi:hypothetical protein
MKIWCTVLRKDGSYTSVPVKPGTESFELDKKVYFVRGFRIGRVGPVKILRAIYVEDNPLPVEWTDEVENAFKKAKLKIDAKAIRHLTDKKILGVYGDAEFTRLEQIFITLSLASLALTAVNMVMIIMVFNKLSGVIP